jgi:hypothetical protein
MKRRFVVLAIAGVMATMFAAAAGAAPLSKAIRFTNRSGKVQVLIAREALRRSCEGGDAGQVTSDDQRLDRVGAFVCVDDLDVDEMTGDVIVEQ